MTYTVVWQPDAEAHLARLWIAASDRAEVAAASNKIDGQLRTRPLELGEGCEGVDRVLAVDPLVVTYEVSEADRLVRVLAVIRNSY